MNSRRLSHRFPETMSPASRLPRRRFLQSVLAAATAPLVVPGAVLGLNGATPPNSRIAFGGIGMGNRALFILPNFLAQPDLQFVAVSDARADRRKASSDA